MQYSLHAGNLHENDTLAMLMLPSLRETDTHNIFARGYRLPRGFKIGLVRRRNT